MIGKTIGHYQILEKLGEGGMGVVYKARDTHLDRFVAIKILPPEKVADPERKRRFVQEAKAASALNHPNIITIYDIDQAEGIDFIAMEYVDGRTLDELIGRKGMKLSEALKVSVQMADALTVAHEAGIIHRDLKPGNVMVTGKGHVKVLDFGLAKLTETLSLGEKEATLTAKPDTEEGKILGTVAYMSPEQAEGKKLDARSDIFSFGSVLYEMVTGRSAFQGDTKASTIAAILKEEPKPGKPNHRDTAEGDGASHYSLSAQRPGTPLADHGRSEGDAAGAQGRVRFRHAGHSSNSAAARRRALWAAGLLTLLCVAAVAIWFVRSTTKAPPERSMTAVPFTSYPGEERQPSFSPDGNQVAFSWNGEKQDNFDIYVKIIGSGAQLRLTHAPEADSLPAWSPDGSSIAFIREGSKGNASVYVISPLGPPEHKVAAINPVTSWPTGLAWTPDGKALIVTDRNSDTEPLGLFVLSVESGEKRRLTSPKQKLFIDSQPAFSADGRTLAFIREVGVGARDIYLLALSEDFQPTGEPKRLTFDSAVTFRPVWTLDGQEIIFSSGPYLSPSLFRIATSGSGKPQRLAGVGEDGSEAAISQRTQRLVYTREFIDVNIWRLEIPGPQGKISPPTKLISSTRVDANARFSPDGKRIAFSSNRSGTI